MNVLYDISLLGLGHILPSARAGIFRSVEHLAEQLILQPACNITFGSNLSWDDIELSKNYLDDNSSLSNSAFLLPVNYEMRNKLLKEKKKIAKLYYSQSNISFFQKTFMRLKSRQLSIHEKILAGFEKSMLSKKHLKKTDIYHSHFFASFENMKEMGVKHLFLTSYDLIPVLHPQFCKDDMPKLMSGILNKLTPETWVVCISEATRNDLLNYMGNRLNPDRVSVTELAASNLFYQSTDKVANQLIRNQYGIPDAPYVLSLCTLEPRKNIDQAIRAFIQLVQQENIPDLNLVLVGAKGWKFEKIFDTIQASEAIKRRIYITGYLADEHLAAMYSDALMFVYPSFYEGFGLPPLEAMQCGVPVITSNTSSLPEVVGDAGMMVSPTDLNELCQAMLSIYKSPALQLQLSQKSMERARLFSWKRCADKTVAAYKKSLLA